jgi:hypothetical protein
MLVGDAVAGLAAVRAQAGVGAHYAARGSLELFVACKLGALLAALLAAAQ